MIQIRKMVLNDYDPVFQIWTSTTGMGLNEFDDSKDGIAKYLNRNPNTCFVALEGGRIVGAILSGHDGRRGYIHHTAVASGNRGQGIGTALLRAAVNALEEENIRKVALVVFEKNQIGNEFWENRGFQARTDLIYRNKQLKETKKSGG